MNKTYAILGAGLLSVGLLSGCGLDKIQEPYHDADRGVTNNDPADIVTNPDGFSNLATKCDHGNRLYVPFHGDAAYAAVAVVPNDPTCANR